MPLGTIGKRNRSINRMGAAKDKQKSKWVYNKS